MPVQEPLSAVDAKRLEQSLSDNAPGRVPLLMACLVAAVIEPRVEQCAFMEVRGARDREVARVEADALGSNDDDGGGVFSNEERRAWLEFHEAEVQDSLACSLDAGWQSVCGRRRGAARKASSSLPVGLIFDAVQDVRLVDCGSRLGNAPNKCFQVAYHLGIVWRVSDISGATAW